MAASALQVRDVSQQRSSPALAVEKRLRRKSSQSFRSGSSEDYPSPHESIYEAVYISATSSEDNGHKVQVINIPPRRSNNSPNITRGHDENTRQVSAEYDTVVMEEIEFRYGHGTPLETITEQRSYGTMNSLARTKSTDELSTRPLFPHRDSLLLGNGPGGPRRAQSFSLDDLALINTTYHDACSMIEREIHKPLPIHEVYAEPKTPTHAPPRRLGTPPGMPSWTAAQNAPRSAAVRPQPKRNRFQRWLNLPASEITQNPRNPIPRTMSNSSRQAPRFRPPKSAYGRFDQHPFVKAANAPAGPSRIPSRRTDTLINQGSQAGPSLPSALSRLTKKVRFTPSATARDSEMMTMQNAIDNTTISTAVQPVTPPSHGLRYVVPTKLKQCPHRKGGAAVLNAFDQYQRRLATNSFNGETSVSIAPSPGSSPDRHISPTSMSASPSPTHISSQSSRHILGLEHTRSVSISSTAHLMSGAIDESLRQTPEIKTEIEEDICWKCKIKACWQKLGQFRVRSTSCLCFFCCGYDVEDEFTVPQNYVSACSGSSLSPTRMRGGGSVGDRRAPRMVYFLHDAPVDML